MKVINKISIRVVSIILSILMLLSFAACGKDQVATTTDKTAKETVASTEETKKEDVTLSVMINGMPQMSGVLDDLTSKEIKRLTGITLDVISTAGMDLDAQISALTASDDLPDILPALRATQRKILLDADAIIPLDELIATNGQEISNKKAGQYAINYSKKFYSTKDKVYFVPLKAGPDTAAGSPLVGSYIRWDLYKAIGMPPVKDRDDLLNVLKQIQDKFPKTPEGKKAYAISGCLGDSGWNIFSLSAIESFKGFRTVDMAFTGGVFIGDLTKYIPMSTDKDSFVWDEFKFFNKAKQMGILDPDTATMKYDQWTEKIAAGQVYYVPFNWLANSMNDDNKLFLPVPIEKLDNDAFTSTYNSSQGQVPYAISKKCKNPDRAMDLLNFAWSYDGAYLIGNGVKDKQWEIVDGKPQLIDSYAKEIKAGGTKATPYEMQFVGPLMDERTNSPIQLTSTNEYFAKYVSTPLVKEYCEKYGVKSPIDNFKKAKHQSWDEAYEWGLAPYSSDLQVINDNVRNYSLLNFPKVLLAKDDNQFEEMKAKFIKDVLAMGAEKLYEFKRADYEKYIQEVLALKK